MHYSQSPPLAEALDLDAMSDQRIGKRLVKPSIHSPGSSSLKDDQVASDRPSVGRRIFRTLTRFFIAVFIGVGGTLAWQSHGDSAKEMVIARAPALAWLLSVSTKNSLPSKIRWPRTLRHCRLSRRTSDRGSHPRLRPRPSRRHRSRSVNPHNPGRSRRLCSHRRYLARRLLSHQSYSRADCAG